MQVVTTTEVQNNFGKYLQLVIDGGEIVIQKNGKEVARLISRDSTVNFLTDSIRGVLKKDYDDKKLRKERLGKY